MHLRRHAHFTACGKNAFFFNGLRVVSKPSETTCKTCLHACQVRLALRKKARAWDRAHGIIKQPAEIKPSGFVQLEIAFQEAFEKAETTCFGTTL